MTVEVVTDLRSQDILRQLRNFEIDAGITCLRPGLPENVATLPLYQERYVLLPAPPTIWRGGPRPPGRRPRCCRRAC
ncbi:hypothetical protein OH717_31800 [Streptomyces albidoflavus]|nr:hypothetical protein [Streptomyces sp. EAG2]WTD06831.1 hypothetical protein OH717_31800 [Streptomyces albidoflavus]